MTALNISCNNLTNDATDMSGVTAVANAITGMGALKFLNVSANGLLANSAPALGDAIKNHKSLQRLDVSKNTLGTKGVRIIFDAANVGVFRVLYASHNAVSKKGRADIGEAMVLRAPEPRLRFDIAF
jgi:hypothetical protein